MAQTGPSMATIFEKLGEFDRIATQLNMPRSERLNILNQSDVGYALLRQGKASAADYVTPELERRLSYALPLMRRLAMTNREPASRDPADSEQLHAA